MYNHEKGRDSHKPWKKLAKYRKTSGLTQQALSDEVGVSKRVIAYYEGETKYPPAHLIIPLAKALRIRTDELLGMKDRNFDFDDKFASLWRRLKVIEPFSEKLQKALLQYVEIIAEKNRNSESRIASATKTRIS